MAAILVIAFSATQDSQDSGAGMRKPTTARVTRTAPEQCPDARKAVRYYGRKLGEWRVKMGAGLTTEIRARRNQRERSCPHVRRLAHTLQRKAHDARLRYEDWYFHEYRWDHWLPAKWVRLGRCETGNTPGATTAGNFGWDSGKYVSFAGILRVAYESYHHWTGHNSPREQYEVAVAIQRRFGWGAWGCGGA